MCLTWGNCCQFGEWFLTDRIFWATFPKHSQNRCFYHVLIPSTTVKYQTVFQIISKNQSRYTKIQQTPSMTDLVELFSPRLILFYFYLMYVSIWNHFNSKQYCISVLNSVERNCMCVFWQFLWLNELCGMLVMKSFHCVPFSIRKGVSNQI